MPYISIIVPVYNTAKYLPKCLDSILNQTFTDFELIIINDGSTDASWSIIEAYAQKDSRIIAISQDNAGLSATRTRGMDAASGEYLWFIDSDDSINGKDALQNIVQNCQHHNLDICMFSATLSLEHDDKISADDYRPDRFKKDPIPGMISGEDLFIRLMQIRQYKPSAVLYAIRRQMLVDNHIRFLDGFIYEDNVFTLQSILKAQKTMLLDHSYYDVHIRMGSITTVEIKMRDFVSMMRVIEAIFKTIHTSKLSPEAYAAATTVLFYKVQDCLGFYRKFIRHSKNNQYLLRNIAKIQMLRFFHTARRLLHSWIGKKD